VREVEAAEAEAEEPPPQQQEQQQAEEAEGQEEGEMEEEEIDGEQEVEGNIKWEEMENAAKAALVVAITLEQAEEVRRNERGLVAMLQLHLRTWSLPGCARAQMLGRLRAGVRRIIRPEPLDREGREEQEMVDKEEACMGLAATEQLSQTKVDLAQDREPVGMVDKELTVGTEAMDVGYRDRNPLSLRRQARADQSLGRTARRGLPLHSHARPALTFRVVSAPSVMLKMMLVASAEKTRCWIRMTAL
jgi:hypothetical protein